MAQNLDVQKKLREEVKSLSMDYGHEELETNPFISAVVNETFRIQPPIFVNISRTVVKPMTLCGVKLRIGDSISPYPTSSNMRPDVFPNPLKFDPNRFIKGATTTFGGEPIEYP